MAKEISMVMRKISKGGFMLGYWKGEQVALIPQYHPDAKPGEYEVHFKREDGAVLTIDLIVEAI